MAGLLAARVLSEHFDRVTVIERDRLPRRPEPRKGVPQGRHLHVLLPRGLVVLESLFPDLTGELLAAGAIKINAGRDVAWHYDGGWRTRHDSALELVAGSRPLIEVSVAARVRALPNVGFREGTRVETPVVEAGAVTGVQVRESNRSALVEAHLLVDATGRGTAMPHWLEQLGYTAPNTGAVPAPLTYATCVFGRPGRGPDWKALFVNGPAGKRAGFCIAVEGDRWLVTLASLFEEPSPRDHQSFKAFARRLPVRDLHTAICDLEPLSAVRQHRFPRSLRHHYDRLQDLPSGLIGIGDAVCSFNPIYGQGMTVAAIEAETLNLALTEARHDDGLDRRFSKRYYQQIAAIADAAWQGIEIEDYRYPELSSRRSVGLRALQWYMARLQRATHADPAVTEQFYRVIGFLDPPPALLRPRTLARVLKPRPAS
jgi:2-polyprenyl-6-methoxyphenol hydroxylase-like FAD-dependent oxidoreductase